MFEQHGMTRPKVTIEYCTQCHWMLRAVWMAQELLTTFVEEIGEVSLKPGVGGVFRVSVEEKVLFDRKIAGRFPDIKELKQIVRDEIAPTKTLGHSESK